MYEKWLSACSEKELFVFYEALYVAYVYEDTKDEEWLKDTKALFYKARECAAQYFCDNCPDFEAWYGFWRWWSVDVCSGTQFAGLLMKMPWNLEKKNA